MDHLIVEILRWVGGSLFVLLGIAGIVLMGFAQAMSDGMPEPATLGDRLWFWGCGALIVAGVLMMIFL